MVNPAYTTETARKPARSNGASAAKAAARVAKAAPAQPTPRRTTALGVPIQPVSVLEHPDLPGVTVRFEYVTPELAGKYLELLPEWQRNESEPTTDEYTEDMIDEDWLFAGDALRFTDEGAFFDGRHRAKAIQKSGRPQWMLLVEGLDSAVMRVMDTGYKRLFTHYLSTKQVKNIGNVSSVTNKILDWRRGNYADSSVARLPNSRYLKAKKSNQKLIYTFESLHDEIVTAVKRGNQLRADFPGSAPATVFAFSHLYLSRLDVFKCAEFFQELTGDSTRRSDDPSYPIRSLEKTLKARANERGIPGFAWQSWIFRAWSHWLEEQNLPRDAYRVVRRPVWSTLPVPTDPHAATRPEGWSVL